jgi:hypothetical protein
MIMCHLVGVHANRLSKVMGSARGKSLRKLMMSAGGLGFDQKLDLAIALRIISDTAAQTAERSQHASQQVRPPLAFGGATAVSA